MSDPMPAENIGPPFSEEEIKRIDEILREAQLNPEDFFEIPTTPDPQQPDMTHDPDIPRTRVIENYNDQNGDGTFIVDREDWQPGCSERFTIRISELWTPPPANLAGKFKLWAKFATVRAVLICRRNSRCRRPQMIGCNHAMDLAQPGGKRLGRANFVFECGEI